MQIQTLGHGTMSHGDMIAALRIDVAELDIGLAITWATYQNLGQGSITLHVWMERQNQQRQWLFKVREDGTGHASHPEHGQFNYANLLEFKQLICGIIEKGYD